MRMFYSAGSRFLEVDQSRSIKLMGSIGTWRSVRESERWLIERWPHFMAAARCPQSSSPTKTARSGSE